MLGIIRQQLQKIIDDIDCGNTNISEDEILQVAEMLNTVTYKPKRLSKYQACQYLNISRATFDNYVREGLLPKGRKEAGFKELSWEKKALDEFINDRKNNHLVSN